MRTNRPRSWTRLPLRAAVSLLGLASMAGAADLPREFDDPPTWVAPAVSPAALEAEDAERAAKGITPARGGQPILVDLEPSTAGRWMSAPEGGRRWQLRLQSADALWIVLGFDEFRLPRGAELRVRDAAGRQVAGPFGSSDVREHGELWLPPIESDTLTLELTWPETRVGEEPALHLGTVTHGYRPWNVPEEATAPAGVDCQIDVACPLGDDWHKERRGIVRLVVGSTGAFCSGALVNDAERSCTPYVLTADHCFDGGGSPASTSFLFHHRLPACEPGSVAELYTLSGSTLRFSYAPSDVRLLELDSLPPADWDVFFNGWSRATTPASEAWTIHHPFGGLMKISHDAGPLSDGIAQGPDHWRVGDWEAGSTDPGSSGGPLFDPSHRIVGQLHADTAACDNPGGWAEFGKFDVSWSNGLNVFLDPMSTNATTLDGMDRSFCGAPEPRLVHAEHLVDDSGGFANGHPDPGESFQLRVTLRNEGPLQATGVGATLSTSHPQVSLSDPSATWSDLSPYQTLASDAPHFTIELDPGFPCGESVPFALNATSNEGGWISEFLLETGLAVGDQSPPPFADDMESGLNGWTVQNLIGSSPWMQVTDDSNSAVTSWHVPNVSGVRDSVLVMPPIATMPPQATLRFAHRLLSEAGDGGLLEYTTNGSDWLDAGAWIAAGPYNSIIPAGFSSPIAGRLAWAGDLGGWRDVEVDLSALEGESVTLRWRFASDTFSGNVGWYVDDVVLDAPVLQCTLCDDLDNDGHCPLPDGDDCDDGDADVYPGAPQQCDGVNNDCDDPVWPSLPFNELDADLDGWTSCAGDCNGADPAVWPTASEPCDGIDNDCNGLVDDDAACDLSCDAAEAAGDEVLVTVHPSTSNEPSIVWNGAGYGVVWSDARDGNLELYFSALDPHGQVTVGQTRLTNAGFDSVNASLVWTGESYAVSWCDERNGPPQLFFKRFDATGAALTADLLLGSCFATESSLVWSGSEFGVAWTDAASEVRIRRLDAVGVPVGADAVLSDGSGTARWPSLVWNGAGYAVAWQGRDGGNVLQIFFTRTDSSGSELPGEQAVTNTATASRRPSLAAAGSGYGLTWGESGGTSRFIDFALLDGAGNVVAGPTAISDSQTGSLGPFLAWSGEEFAVLWRDVRDGNGEVYLGRVDAAGDEVGSETRLSFSATDSLPEAPVWTGTEYAVAWSESPRIHFARLGCNCFDADEDGRSSCNDNCSAIFNPSQSDLDGDFEGDHCDLDDGQIYLRLSSEISVDWQPEQGFDAWNYYKGDLAVLRSSALYTQTPGSNDLAARQCGLPAPNASDPAAPASGQTAFFLVAGVSAGVESDLGRDSTGTLRPNDSPCP